MSIVKLYSAIHKATRFLAIGHSQKAASRNAPQRLFQLVASFTAYGTFFSGMVEQWNCTSQIME